MQPIPIPDALVPEHFTKHTIGAPAGLEDNVRPVEVIIPRNSAKRFIMLVQATTKDLELMQVNGGLMWLQIYGNALPPFSIDPVEDVEVVE